MPKPFKLFLLLLVSMGFLFSPVRAQILISDPTETEPAPPVGPITEIEFEATSYDFGRITEGAIVTQVFTFTNVGSEPLIISDAKGSCGCTVPAKPSGSIQPGETASITVQFNSRGKRGMRNQKVTLTANTNPSQIFLYLAGEVLVNEASETTSESSFAIRQTAEPVIPKDCFAIYPNPTAEILKLSMAASTFGKAAEVAIYSQDGELMARRRVESIVGDIEFGVSHYPAGTYFAKVNVGGEVSESRCFVVID